MINDIVNIGIATIQGREERLKKCIQAIYENTDFPYMISLHLDCELLGCIRPTRKILSLLNPDSLVIILNDDMIVQKKWLSTLVAAYKNRFPNYDGIAQPNDGYNDGAIATCPFSTPKFLLEHWNPEYHHYFGDCELTERSKILNKYLYVPESTIVHEHLSEEEDPSYKHANKWWSIDQKKYEERKKINYGLCVKQHSPFLFV